MNFNHFFCLDLYHYNEVCTSCMWYDGVICLHYMESWLNMVIDEDTNGDGQPDFCLIVLKDTF